MSRFAAMVKGGMDRSGLGLRELCRRSELDPSYLSKVLSGKRSPPAEEAALRRLAAALELEPAELVVAAGRIPLEWSRLSEDPGLFDAVHRLIGGQGPSRRAAAPKPPGRAADSKTSVVRAPAPAFNEELL